MKPDIAERIAERLHNETVLGCLTICEEEWVEIKKIIREEIYWDNVHKNIKEEEK